MRKELNRLRFDDANKRRTFEHETTDLLKRRVFEKHQRVAANNMAAKSNREKFIAMARLADESRIQRQLNRSIERTLESPTRAAKG